jgi:transposase
LITDAAGIPLAVILTGGHRNDVTQLLPLLDAVPPIRGLRGRPRRRPGKLYADRGYDHDNYRQLLGERGITLVIAGRGTAHGSGLGRLRWVVERTLAWLHAFPTAPHPLRTPRRHPPRHDQPRLLDHLPPETAHRALTSQGKNPARVCTNHCGSSSQG